MKVWKMIFCLMVATMVVPGFVIDVLAAPVTGEPVLYEMTFTKFEMNQGAEIIQALQVLDNWVTVKDSPTTVDLAGNIGDLAGAITGGSIPVGTYNATRTTISTTMRIKGYIESGGSVYYTTAATQYDAINDVIGSAAGVLAGNEANFLANIPNDYAACNVRPMTGTTFTTPAMLDGYVVAEGTVIDQSLGVDIGNGLELINMGPGGDVIFPGAPNIFDNADD